MLIFVSTVNGYICNCYCPNFVGIVNCTSCTTPACTQACGVCGINACSFSPTVMG